MAEPQKKIQFGVAKSMVIGLCVAAVVYGLVWFDVLDKNELFVVDMRYTYRPAPTIDTEIVTVDIDDPSIDQIGRWPWTWDRHALVLDYLRLYGGNRIAFVEPYYNELGTITVQKEYARQIALSVSQIASAPPAGAEGVDFRREVIELMPDYNERFLKSMERFPNTFIGSAFTIPEGDIAGKPAAIREMTEDYKVNFSSDKKIAIDSMDTFSIPWPDPGSLLMAADVVPVADPVSRRMGGAGFTRIIQDADGIVRRTPLVVWYDGRLYPSIALSMAARYFECELRDLIVKPGRYIEMPGKKKTVRVPIDRQGNMIVNWTGAYQETFLHIPFNVIAYHYAHRIAKSFVRRFQVGFDNPQEVMQKLHQFLTRQKLVSPAITESMTQQILIIWLMDFMIDRGATYESFLASIGAEPGDVLRYWWNHVSVNKRAEEIMRTGQTPDYTAVLFSLDIKDTDIFREGFDRTVYAYASGKINDLRPLHFMDPSIIDVSGVEIKFSPREFGGRTIFVGLTATGLNAFNPTPYQQRYQMFGLQPNAYNTIVTEQFLKAQASWVEYLYILVYAFGITWLVLHVRPMLGFVVMLLTALLHTGVGWLIFMGPGVIIPIVSPVLTIVLSYVCGNLYRYVEEQRERQKVRTLFSAMVSPEVLRMMEEHPEKFRLAGEKHEATMFSSDVSGFTTISEGVTAQELADILNIYLTPMSNIIMNFDGFVDKYEGDAIKADFGVPIPDPNHPWKCCYAALLQQEDLAVIQRLLLLKYGVKITARMGVNTGIVAAGNMGSEKKMQYTVMGEAVTIAEELEPINKLYETWIAIGPLTLEKAHAHVEVRHLDRVLMGPGGHPHDVYELMGWRREKFMEYWSGRPVPPLFIDAWRKLTPEKILGYIYYWDQKKLVEGPFYKDTRALFEQLAPLAMECIKSTDIAALLTLREELADLEKVLGAYDPALISKVADPATEHEISGLKKQHEKVTEDWLKLLMGWKIQLKEEQVVIQNFWEKIDTLDFDELSRRVDTYQKRVECCIKRISFPNAADKVGYELAEHLKGLLLDGGKGPGKAAAQAHAEEQMRAIRSKVDPFLAVLPARAEQFHEFLADHCVVPDYKFKVREKFDEARRIYLTMDWDKAEAAFKAILEIDPKDGPAIKYIERLAHLRKHPPAPDWDGNWAEE